MKRVALLLLLLAAIVLFLSRPRATNDVQDSFPYSNNQPTTIHKGDYPPTSLLDLAFTNLDLNSNLIPRPPVIIIPHHLLAARLISAALARVHMDEAITVTIISPDHFFAGETGATTSLATWETPYGFVASNEAVIQTLAANAPVKRDEKPFEKEHGVYNILPFIKKLLPNARVVPIIIKTNLNEKTAKSLGAALARHLPENALFIASLDFSHEVTQTIAEQQDAQSISILDAKDSKRVGEIAVDCRACIHTIFEYAHLRGAFNFHLLANSNSANLLRKPEQKDVTSYIIGYFSTK